VSAHSCARPWTVQLAGIPRPNNDLGFAVTSLFMPCSLSTTRAHVSTVMRDALSCLPPLCRGACNWVGEPGAGSRQYRSCTPSAHAATSRALTHMARYVALWPRGCYRAGGGAYGGGGGERGCHHSGRRVGAAAPRVCVRRGLGCGRAHRLTGANATLSHTLVIRERVDDLVGAHTGGGNAPCLQTAHITI
jgi:hypothetical protein